MKYDIEIYDKYIYVRFSRGTNITFELVKEVLARQRDVRERKTINDIWDVRGCLPDRNLNSKSLVRLVEYIKNLHSPDLYHQRSAMIVDSELAFGVSRMYQTLAEELPFQIEIFEDDQQAKEWILS